MIRFISHRWVQVVLLLMLLGGSVALRLLDPGFIRHNRQLTFDWYNKLMPRLPGHGVAIVDIDEKSLQLYGQWPWPRPLIGDISLILREMGAKAVAFDMVFAEADRTSPKEMAKSLENIPNVNEAIKILKSLPDNDKVFAEKIAKAGNTVMGFVATDQLTGIDVITKEEILIRQGPNLADIRKFLHFYPYYTSSLKDIVDAAAGNGSFTPATEADSVIRRILAVIGYLDTDKKVQRYPALSLEALRVSQNNAHYFLNMYALDEGNGIKSIRVGEYIIPTEKDGSFRIYYSKLPREDISIPAWKVLSGKVSPDLVKDKIIFVGASAIGLRDLRSSPMGDNLMAGVQAHAEAAEQILSNQFLQRPDSLNTYEQFSVIVISLFIIFLAPFISTGILALLVVVLIGIGGVGALYAYRDLGYLIDPVYPSLSIVIIFIMSSILTNLRSEMERRAVRNAFSFYISPALMEELTGDPDKLKLGGEVRELSVMFTDIRNFTTISESMDPADLIRMMNDFLTPMTSCVLDNRGTIDKYMGDAMMAFWNAPLDDPDHARHACIAALQMLTALAQVNEAHRAQAEKTGKAFAELKAGIAIHTGRCSVGNMGSKQRFAYSAIGDTVNLASRLEGQTKSYGISVMISEEVRQQAPEFAAIEIDLLTVKGRAAPERVYTLLGDAAMAGSAEFQAFATSHSRMLTAYREQKWDEALALAEQCRGMRPDLAGLYALYRQRSLEFKTKPPEPGWQGIWVAKEK